jgi:hypothetical protein
MSEKNKERAFIRFNLIARSVPPPIASVTNGGVIVLVDAPLGRNLRRRINAWAIGAATFSSWAQ